MFDRELAVRDNLGLVRSCASRFRGKGTDYDDLYQAGCMGLVKAAANYDESLGFRFSTYAVPVILGEIKRLFRDGGSFRVSRSLKELGLKARNARERFILEKGREPAVSELAELLCMKTGFCFYDMIKNCKYRMRRMMSYYSSTSI